LVCYYRIMSKSNGEAKRFNAAHYQDDGKHHVLLAASGSVATIKLPLITKALIESGPVSIRIVLTESATEFLQGQSDEQPTLQSLTDIPGVDGIYLDNDEWAKPWVRGDKILHIELRRWAHILLIAPLSANTMAKMVNGISDGLLLSVIRAWDTTGLIDGRRKIIYVAPAMNTAMWRHPITKKQVTVLDQDWGQPVDGWVKVLRPTEKELACGDVGDGAMMEWRKIVETVSSHFATDRDGKAVMV
jgi:phosphopantothenoylcysteine decarboxylase